MSYTHSVSLNFVCLNLLVVACICSVLRVTSHDVGWFTVFFTFLWWHERYNVIVEAGGIHWTLSVPDTCIRRTNTISRQLLWPDFLQYLKYHFICHNELILINVHSGTSRWLPIKHSLPIHIFDNWIWFTFTQAPDSGKTWMNEWIGNLLWAKLTWFHCNFTYHWNNTRIDWCVTNDGSDGIEYFNLVHSFCLRMID